MFQGVPFLSIGVVEAVAPLNTPSGLDRGETSVIICFSRCLWVQGSEGCSLWCWGWGSTDQIIPGGHCCCHSPLCCCSCFSLQPGSPHHAASPPDSLAYEPIFSTPCSLHLSLVFLNRPVCFKMSPWHRVQVVNPCITTAYSLLSFCVHQAN